LLNQNKSNQRSSFIDSIPSTPATSIEEKSLIDRSLQFSDMLNLGEGIQTQQKADKIDRDKRMNWTRLRDGVLSVKKFKKMKEVR